MGISKFADNQAVGSVADTKSVAYGYNQSLDKLGGTAKLLTDDEIKRQEERDNALLASQKSELESLQRQKPPTNKEDYVEYLMKRLEAAENSIKV